MFSPAFAQQVRERLTGLRCVEALSFPLYGNSGDLLGMLARLLVWCRDTKQLQPLVQRADALISQMDIDVKYMTDSDYIRHLRNAVLHSRFNVTVEGMDPPKSVITFLDIRPDGREVTAKITLTNEQLIKVMGVIIDQVFEPYLAHQPDGTRWVVN